jgi:hypothetical protein
MFKSYIEKLYLQKGHECVCVSEREEEKERGEIVRGGKGATNQWDLQVTCPIFIPPPPFPNRS